MLHRSWTDDHSVSSTPSKRIGNYLFLAVFLLMLCFLGAAMTQVFVLQTEFNPSSKQFIVMCAGSYIAALLMVLYHKKKNIF